MSTSYFDSQEHVPEKMPYEPLKAGKYELEVMSVVEKETKNKTGKYVEVTFDVIGQNKRFWDRFNIQNQNEMAQKIGREQFAGLVRAIKGGDAKFTSFEEVVVALEMRKVSANITVKTNKGTGKPENVVLFYSPLDKHTTEDKTKRVTYDEVQNASASKDDDLPF